MYNSPVEKTKFPVGKDTGPTFSTPPPHPACFYSLCTGYRIGAYGGLLFYNVQYCEPQWLGVTLKLYAACVYNYMSLHVVLSHKFAVKSIIVLKR